MTNGYMFDPVILKDSAKVSALLSLLSRFHAEETRYRDYEWKIVVLAIGLLIGVITQLDQWGQSACMKSALTLFAVCVSIIISIKIGIVHDRFINNRNNTKKVETILGFFDKEASTIRTNLSLMRSGANQ